MKVIPEKHTKLDIYVFITMYMYIPRRCGVGGFFFGRGDSTTKKKLKILA
jgi:hypothetical protein